MSTSLLVIEKGTIVKINGIPFELNSDTIVRGRSENLKLIKKEDPTAIKVSSDR